MAPIVLYHFNLSAPSRSALLTIRNLKLDVDIKVVNLFAGEHRKEEFVKINPQHTVPTLVDNGFTLWESRAISAYLVDAKSRGNTLYPIDPKQRSVIDQRLYFDAGTLWPKVIAIVYPIFFAGATRIPDDKRKALHEALEHLDGFLQGKTWIAGSNVTIADLSLLASVSSIAHAGLDLKKYSNISAWYVRTKSLPGWAENDAGAKLWGEKVASLLKDDKF